LLERERAIELEANFISSFKTLECKEVKKMYVNEFLDTQPKKCKYFLC